MVVAGDGRAVVSTDMLVEGRHFRLDWSSPHDVGRKAIAQNAADIEAMGAAATAFVVAFGAPGDTSAAQAVELADGMWQEARTLGAGIVGGDLVSAPQWVISVTALGDLAGRTPVLRSGARVGDTLAVAGVLGRSAAGYHLWHNNIDGFDELRRRHAVPQPPYGQGRAAADEGATAMTDVSDGLVADLGHIADASGVGVNVSTAALTVDHDALAASRRRRGCRRMGVGARRRRRPRAGRDVSRCAAARLAGHRHGDRRSAPCAGRRRRMARNPGLAVLSMRRAARFTSRDRTPPE